MNDMFPARLRPEEVLRLRALMRKARIQRVAWDEEAELRSLISKQGDIPSSMPWDRVVETGMFIVGMYAIAKDLGELDAVGPA